jgi:hypothetical protein
MFVLLERLVLQQSPPPLPERWNSLGSSAAAAVEAELEREICSTHALHGIKASAVAQLEGRDDVLYRLDEPGNRWVVVHLTWHKEQSPDWPYVTWFCDFQDFSENWRRIWD